jgi:hypothetical protein
MWGVGEGRTAVKTFYTSDTEARSFTVWYVTNSTRHLVVHFALQKQEKATNVNVIHIFLTPTGLMFPRVIDMIDNNQWYKDALLIVCLVQTLKIRK